MSPSCSVASPLSQSQKTIWALLTKGLSVKKAAEKLNTTRQYVNQTRLAAQAKLQNTLIEVAQVNDIQITKIYSKQAILLGYHPALKRKAIITYTTNHGLKVWYWHDNPEEVTDPVFLNQTRQYLIDIAKERGIEIPNADNIHPARLAHEIFSKLIPELKT
jgi:DNA-binding CsgD family transcriptional regulator